MNLPETKPIASPVQMLVNYHRLLRIVEEDGHRVLDEDSAARLVALLLERIRQLELPAAVELDRAREARGFAF